MNCFQKLIATLKILAKELADENAYARYLNATGQKPSKEQWRRFSDLRVRSKYRNGRCC